MGENIGAAARAMLNFGIAGLRLVAPRDGWPNPAAKAMAAGASIVIDHAQVFETLDQALADLSFVLATTARPREARLPVFTPALAVQKLREKMLRPGQEGAETCGHSSRVAVLFGGERAGLSAEHIKKSDGVISIPVNPDFASLNLAQAVLLMAYEWGQASGLDAFESPLDREPAAPRLELDRMMTHLEEELEAAGFFYPPEKKPLMLRNLTTALTRAGLTHIEVQTMRGVIKALAKGRGRAVK